MNAERTLGIVCGHCAPRVMEHLVGKDVARRLRNFKPVPIAKAGLELAGPKGSGFAKLDKAASGPREKRRWKWFGGQ